MIQKIRLEDKFSPVFMLTAYSKKNDIVEGLKAGADDYITKPFHFEELLQRVHNAVEKSKLKTQTSEDELKLLPTAAAFLRGDRTVNLTRREYVIFEKLFLNDGNPTTREELISCFNAEDKMTIRNIDVHIFSLRKKVKQVDLRIETVWGLGYKLAGL